MLWSYLQQLLFCVSGVSAAERDDVKSVKEGESVTLHPCVINNPNDSMAWYYNDVCIAEITGGQSQICTDVQCADRFRDRLELDQTDERFRDRLKLDQTGSLTITDTRTIDSGDYILHINSSSFSIRRTRSLSVSGTGECHSKLNKGLF